MENLTLYERLGKKSGIEMKVKYLVDLLIDDVRVRNFFLQTAHNRARRATFETNLVDFICSATGGPEEYKGQPMGPAHQGRGITSGHFTAVVDDIKITLDHFKVGPEEQRELLALLAPLREAIVS